MDVNWTSLIIGTHAQLSLLFKNSLIEEDEEDFFLQLKMIIKIKDILCFIN